MSANTIAANEIDGYPLFVVRSLKTNEPLAIFNFEHNADNAARIEGNFAERVFCYYRGFGPFRAHFPYPQIV
jgi:hypothetical protein